MTLLPRGASALSNPTIATDKADYSPEQTVTVTGTGFDPGASYDVPVIRPDGSIVHGDGTFTAGWDTVTTDADGSFVYHYQLDGIQGIYEVRVYASPWGGDRSQAPITSLTFHDATSSDLDGCADGNPADLVTGCTTTGAWTNGDLNSSGANASQYFEGDSVPYRIRFSGLPAGTHTVHIVYDTTQAGDHAFDYLTSFDRTITVADPCAGVAGCSGPPTSFTIPTDSNLTGAGVTPVSGSFKAYNATITGASAYTLTGSYAANSSTDIQLTFTTSVATPVIAFGMHIASRGDWGANNSAAAIGGSPFHVGVSAPDGSGSQQAKQIKAGAIIFPASITIIKDAVPNSAQDFSYTTTGGLTPSTFQLDDDSDPTLSNTQAYTGITNFAAYTFTEAAVAGWTTGFASPPCTVTTANGGTQSASGQTLTVNLAEGENVTCTFTNTNDASITLVKKTVGGNGTFNFTGSGAGIPAAPQITTAGGSGSAGPYTITSSQLGTKQFTETVPAGWDLTNIACTGGSPKIGVSGNAASFNATFDTGDNSVTVTPSAGDAITCTFTNTQQAGTLVLKKHVVNDNGGSKTAADFNLHVKSGGVDVTGSPAVGSEAGTSYSLAGGSYTVSEDAPPSGYLQTGISGDCSGNGVVTVTPGQTVTCTITNDDKAASLTVIKHVVNANGGTKSASDFTMNVTGTNVSPSSSFAGAESPGTTVSLNAGSYSVSETGPSGYTESDSADCVGSIANGESKTCTITNSDQAGTLIVIKHVVNDDGGTKSASNFSMTVNGTNVAPAATFAGAESPGTTVSLSAGAYSVTETGSSGYTESDSTDCSGSIANGQTKTCTITNNDKPGTLVVIKHVVNDNGGTNSAGDFTMNVTGTNVSPSSSFAGLESPGKTVTLNAGSYSVAESGPSGYAESDSADCSGSIANGQTKTCTITNDDKAATLTVIKHVSNTNGGTNSAADFTMDVTGSHVAPASTFPGAESPGTSVTLDAGSYSVTESGPAGYTEHDSADCSGSIALGEAKTCTITNQDQPATLTVIKHVVNDNGGSNTASDFTMQVNGTNVAPSATFSGAESPGTTVTLNAGNYSVSETGPSGYAQSNSVDCTGSIANGESKTCTVTNDDKQGTLVVIKHVVANNGGNAVASDFTMSVNGTNVLPSASFPGDEAGTTVTLDAGSYSVSESGPSGYTETNSADCLGTMTNGGIKTCFITNDDQAASLFVIKHVINDNGGTAKASDFTLASNGVNASPASFPGDEGGTAITLDAGAYGVTETGPSGYTQSLSADCTGVIGSGGSKACTVTNDDQAGTLTVIKHVITDNGGTAKASDFTMSVNGTNVAPSASFAGAEAPGTTVTLDAGSYSVTESGPSGYTETDSADCTGSIANGESKTCTVTNDDQAGTLTVIKHVDNGVAAVGNVASDFTMNVTGGNVLPSASFPGDEAGTTVTLDAGPYSVTEGGPSGYIESDSADCAGTIANGVTKTCTVTNTKLGSVGVIKNELGVPTTGQYTFTLTGGPVPVNLNDTTNTGANTNTLSFPSLQAGSYTLCETVPAGYGTDLGTAGNPCATFTLSVGEDKVFTVNNTPCPAGTLSVEAQILPSIFQGADTQTFHFDISGPGGFTTTTSITFHAGDTDLIVPVTVPQAGTYTVDLLTSAPFKSATTNVDILPAGCASTAQFSPSFAPPQVDVTEITDPPGYEAGWQFTLNQGATAIDAATSAGPVGAPITSLFPDSLGEAQFSVVQTPQAGWQQVSATGCSFTVNLPAAALNSPIHCVIKNVASARVTVIKTEQLSGAPHAARGRWVFTLHGGNVSKTVAFALKMNTRHRRNVINFGRSVPIGNYIVCENPFGAWRSSLLSMPGGFKNAKGQSCAPFSVTPGQHKIISVNNQCTASAKASERRLPQ